MADAVEGQAKRRRVEAIGPAGGATTRRPRMPQSEVLFLLVLMHTTLQLAALAAHPELRSLLSLHRDVAPCADTDGGADNKKQATTDRNIESSSCPGKHWTTLSVEQCMDRIASRLHFGVATPATFFDFLRVVNCHLMPVQTAGPDTSMQEHALRSGPLIFSRGMGRVCLLPTDVGLGKLQSSPSQKLSLLKLMTGHSRKHLWLLSLMA